MYNLSITEYSYYYTLNSGNKSYVVSFVFTLDDEIDIDILKRAIDITKKYFKRYGMRLIITNDGNIVFIENCEDVEIYDNLEKKVYLGTEESNYYLFRVICINQKIYFSFSHLLGDGLTMINFCENVLYHYYEMKGEKYTVNDNIRTEENMIAYDNALPIKINENYNLSKDEEDIIKNIIFKNKSNIEKANYKMSLDDSMFDKKEFYIEKIVCDADDFIGIIHKYNTTPLTFLFMLFSNALINVEHISNEKIKAGIAVNMRKCLECKSDYNFGTLSFISYDTDWSKLSYTEQMEHIKSHFEKFLDKNTLMYMCKLFIDLSNDDIDSFNISKIDTILEKLKSEYKATSGGIFISNIGNIKLGESISKHVKNVEFINTPTKNDYEIHMLTYKNKMTLYLTMNGRDKGIFKEIHNIMKEFGISSNYEERVFIENDHINPLLFMRQ